MASISSITPQRFLHISRPTSGTKPNFEFSSKARIRVNGLSGSSLPSCCKHHNASKSHLFSSKKRTWKIGSTADDLDVIPVQSTDLTDQQNDAVVRIEREEEVKRSNLVGGFSNEGRLSFESGVVVDIPGFSSSSLGPLGAEGEVVDVDRLIDQMINAVIVLAAGTFAITKLITIDRDYWHGWTLYEILRYAPQHNWSAYEEALKANPVLAKMMISGVVYSLGDWIAQCYEGKPLFEYDRARMLRSGLVGFSLHGSLSHYYYRFCEALFPFHDWWVVPAKVLFDQTVWSAVWNSIYFVLLGFLRFESPANIFSELKATFFPMLTVYWRSACINK
ncbi:uncharacterized protein LOC131230357 isoform X2 [Magnolia sinica]|uniref:uncharacterized protein LOC131230357 isoform X2 n=1 Tax=Magnolia sinica TaxID=86752 RepID=UPI00265AB7EC|nr:uncharacterized protein LOC131230357 isoform X2 [Magnolia sinica]